MKNKTKTYKQSPLFLICGKSGSGKTTLANQLCTNGLRELQSYTTRPKRYTGETGHTFVTDEQFDTLNNIVAYGVFDKYKYAATREQLNNADIYVIDSQGIINLQKLYLDKRDIYIVYLKVSPIVRWLRMIERKDGIVSATRRVIGDYFRFKDIEHLCNNKISSHDVIDVTVSNDTYDLTLYNCVSLQDISLPIRVQKEEIKK